MKMNEPPAGGRPTLPALEQNDAFVGRHVGPSAAEQAHMLGVLGYPSRAAMIAALIPGAIRRQTTMDLPPPCTEAEALAEIRAIAAKNKVLKSCIGQGYYGTHTPGVILRNILENPAWYTAYTPYQPEIAQGRLEALVNFQTMVCDLTGMPIANASMLDEATAAAEAMTHGAPGGQESVERVHRRRRLPSADDRRRPDPRQAAGHRGRRGLAPQLIDEREFFGVLAQYPVDDGPDTRHAPAGGEDPCQECAALRGQRSAGADSARAPGRMGRRCRRRQRAALRRADGLRRAARRLFRHPRRIQAHDARTPGRRHRRRRRRPRVPSGAADARAAYPPRKGDVEHLHRGSPAGGDRRDVRRLSRTRRPHPHCVARAPPGGDPEGRTRAPRARGADAALLRHPAGQDRRADRGDSRARRPAQS